MMGAVRGMEVTTTSGARGIVTHVGQADGHAHGRQLRVMLSATVTELVREAMVEPAAGQTTWATPTMRHSATFTDRCQHCGVELRAVYITEGADGTPAHWSPWFHVGTSVEACR